MLVYTSIWNTSGQNVEENLTSAHVLRRVSASSAGGLLDVVGALSATAAQGVRLVVALTEACRTLAYHLQRYHIR